MRNQNYPFVGWVLSGSFVPKEVEFVSHRRWWGEDWHGAGTGKDYKFDAVFITKEDAIASGHLRIAAQEARIARQAATLAKKRANLAKNS